MQDNVALLVDGKRIETFLSYRCESDIYTADDAFSLELANPKIRIKKGDACKLLVNEQVELYGIVDRVKENNGKEGRKLTVEGRDLAGILVDSDVTDYTDLTSITLADLASRLLKTVPFINRKAIRFEGKGGDVALANVKMEPGNKIFDMLKEHAFSRGLLFWIDSEGNLVFGKPKDKPQGEVPFRLVCRKNGTGNNIIEGEKVEDISKSASDVTVMAQQQGSDSMMGFDDVNSKATVHNPDFPNGFYKPFVTHRNMDHLSPQGWAQLLVDQMRFQQLQISYKTHGHSQKGKNWKFNEFCHVDDEVFGLNGDYLVFGRTFEMSKEEGVTTTVKLGLPGVLLQ